MILITPEDRVAEATELFESLKRSVNDLRQMAEDLKAQIDAGEEADLTRGKRQVSDCAALIRNCQTVEAQLVKLRSEDTGIVQGGYALDLDRARFEIGCRLARLRACCGAGEVPG
ncbi:MAG TPA: hypothetical protein DEA05_12870 [Rhodobacteraceae bacterium]|nr:hypothetical protein [Paracoccaceae bacterium]